VMSDSGLERPLVCHPEARVLCGPKDPCTLGPATNASGSSHDAAVRRANHEADLGTGLRALQIRTPGRWPTFAGTMLGRLRSKVATEHSGDGDCEEHIWQRRFYDFVLWSAQKSQEKLHYIHQNPVERGLAAAVEQCPVLSSWRVRAGTGE
jgi:hypothetical protein